MANRQPISFLSGKMQRPELSRGVVLTSILAFWLFYVVVVTLRASLLGYDHQGEMAYRRAIVTCIGILVTIILWRMLALFDRKPLGVRITTTIVAALPCALAIAAANHYFFNVYDAATFLDEKEMQQISAAKHMSIEIAEATITRYFFLIAWASFYLALGFSNDVRESEQRASQFAKAAQEAELRALRYQVNPHFLFNTLNSLSSLVMKDRKAEAETMIMNLAHFFRASLSGDPSADVPLSDEVQMQRLYLDIEGVRFPSRLSNEILIPDALGRALVPGLILQPLIENTIKHGVARTNDPVKIRIEANTSEGQLVLTVADDARKPSADPLRAEEWGIGLSNVRDRLAARFGEDARFEVKRPVAGGFVATITMPLVLRD
jgi:two-component system, LytTR family, sensor kinase